MSGMRHEVVNHQLWCDTLRQLMKMINSIDEYCRPIEVIIYDGDPIEDRSPEVALGWIKHGEYSLQPSEEGYQILDGLKKQGVVDIGCAALCSGKLHFSL